MLYEPFVPKPDARYAWTSGVIRSLEKKLLSRVDYQKFIDLDESEVPQFLNEFGYRGDLYGDNDLDEHVVKLLNFLDKHSHNKDFTDEYRLRWDYKNVAHVLKKHLLDRKIIPEDVLPWGKYTFDDCIRALEGEKSAFPERLVKAKHRARIDYDTEQQIWRVGMILDHAYLEGFLDKLPKDNKYIRQYYSVQIDELNVTSALRFAEFDYVSRAFQEFGLDFGYIPLDFYDSIWETDRSGRANQFIHTFYGKPLQEAVAESLDEDDMLPVINFFAGERRAILDKSIYSAFGLEVLIAYFEKKRMEIETLRALLRMKGGNLAREEMERAVSYVGI